MIAIINYEAGNLASVSNALKRLEVRHQVTSDPDRLEQAKAAIFPGVGHALPAMQSLRKNGLDEWLKQTSKPVLGICLGMQLLYEHSGEGDTEGLGIIPGRLEKFDAGRAKVPHMGWNTFEKVNEHPLLNNLDESAFFYFVHSYYAPVNRYTRATCHYINEFAAVACKDNITGVQFHPEKSAGAGVLMLKNFLEMVEESDLPKQSGT